VEDDVSPAAAACRRLLVLEARMSRHACSCGASYEWPLDLWEHMIRAGHAKGERRAA
jgi:hypothetical protein